MHIIRIKHVTRECLQRPQKKKNSSARSGSILLFVSFASLRKGPQDRGLPFSLPEGSSLSQKRSGGAVEVAACAGRGRRAVLLGAAALALQRPGALGTALPSHLVLFLLQMDFNCKRHRIQVTVVWGGFFVPQTI